MANSIPEALRQILAEQYDEDQLAKILAQVFCNGASVVFHPDGSRQIFPETVLDIGLGSSSSDTWTKIETPPEDWDKLLQRPPKQIEIVVFPGNFGRGAHGKHDETTWKKDDFTTETAPMRAGYAVTTGHRGGMRQATSRPVMRKFFNQSYKLRRYR